MSSLANLFAEIEDGLNRAQTDLVSGFPDSKKPDPEQQVIKDKSFSGVSGISGTIEGTTVGRNENAHRAGAQERVGARAWVSKKPPGKPETSEKPAGAETYFSGSLSRNPEKEKESGKASTLRGAPADLSPDEAAAFDERAGFLEHDGGLSRAEAERQALAELRPQRVKVGLPAEDGIALWRAGLELLSLDRQPCDGYRGEDWPRTLIRARSFLDNFGAQAEALGWTAPRLFGVHPQAGIGRVDHCGALVLPIGGPVLAITAEEIKFGHLTHRMKPGQPEGVPVWELGR